MSSSVWSPVKGSVWARTTTVEVGAAVLGVVLGVVATVEGEVDGVVAGVVDAVEGEVPVPWVVVVGSA